MSSRPLELFKGTVRVLGRQSPDALYSNDLVSFDSDTLDQCHVRSASPTISESRRECHIPCSSREKQRRKMNDYATFFPAFAPGVHSNTSVILRISNPFAG